MMTMVMRTTIMIKMVMMMMVMMKVMMIVMRPTMMIEKVMMTIVLRYAVQPQKPFIEFDRTCFYPHEDWSLIFTFRFVDQI